ncbi:hypothetical protein [Bacillus cereus]|uniref:hypothetical protein n=1 Tax=Bacillus cereus TaxID=1396 RepID=UPI0018F7413E
MCPASSDQVMIVANSSARNVSNGDTGKIIAYDDKGVCLDLDGREIFYKYEDTEEVVS